MKSLAQMKLDAKTGGWPWPIVHPNDERALLAGCCPDFAAAERVRRFYANLLVVPRMLGDEEDHQSTSGGLKPFVLLDWWYRDVLAPLFGWKRRDGRRRFDKGFITTAKKTGKSTVLAGLPLYMIVADKEEEAEAYAAATGRDQASIVYKKTARMAKLSPELNGVLKRIESQKRIVHEDSGSYFEAISSDADSAEGKNPHLLITDELHVWKNRQFFNALMYGDIARAQPLFLMITTAGEDPMCVGFEEYQFAKDLLNPDNDFYSESHFAFISEAAPDREWDDPDGWLEANPSLACGAIGSLGKLQAKCDEAKQSPRKKREFVRYICNRWVDSVADPWITQEQWDACDEPVPEHFGDECFGGLDLSSSIDITAFCLAFPNGEYMDFKWWFWMPAQNVRELERRDKAPYGLWIKDKWICTTPGNKVDYAYIRQTISGVVLDERGQPLPPAEDCLAKRYQIVTIGFDPWNASKLDTELREYDGIDTVEMRQGTATLNRPCKEFERLVADRKIRHGNNPVMNWMIGHCVVDTDTAGNIKPNKKKSIQKIDGVSAAMNAIGLAIGHSESVSIYETPGAMNL